jgi:radical SAM family uncharacterized protein/radical SAM-linked protein
VEWFDDILRRIRRPGRYLGCEVNAVRKDPDAVAGRVALAYPDRYELAMSYLGLQVLYDAVNREADLWAERVFAPDLDMEAELRKAGKALGSLESGTPLGDFDLVGFTLQHELTYPDVLGMLQLGRIPVRADQRGDEHPFVVAGGPGAANPEPLAPALDAAFLGDGEAGLVEMARIVARGRARKAPRQEILDELMGVTGVYVPSRYRFEHDASGALLEIRPQGRAPAVVRRRLLLDIDRATPPPRPVLPCSETIHERYTVEIQRGCTRGCRFCQAGMINRPVRQRSAGSILDSVTTGLKHTGYGQVSFLSLSAGDHPHILQILERFYQKFAGRRIAASLPSLRAETLTPSLIHLVKTVRKSGFTIAPEAGTDRLRRVINKPLTDADVLAAARGAFSAGWRLIKLYFMLGLPTETQEDRDAIVELVGRTCRELKSAGHRPRINVGLSTFVPKPHTPFQWERMLSLDEATERLGRLRRDLARLPGVKTGWARPEMSWAEGLISRGDRRLFSALLKLAEDGRRLQGWSEHFDLERFRKPFDDLGLPGGPEAFFEERSPGSALAWDHLDMGPGRDFLLTERERAFEETPTEDCARGACSDCGACDEKDAAIHLDDTPVPESVPTTPPPVGDPVRIRLTLTKQGPWRHLSHIEFMLTLRRALRRASWPLWHTQGYHPKPKTSFGPACPVGISSQAELADVTVTGPVDLENLIVALRSNLPGKMDLVSAEVLSPGAASILGRGAVARYRFSLDGRISPEEAESGAHSLLTKREWVVSRIAKGKHRIVEVRPSLRSLVVETKSDRLEAVCELLLDSSATARPAEVVQAAFGLTHIPIVREAVFKQPEDCRERGGGTL